MENRNSPTLFAVIPNVSRPRMRCSPRVVTALLWLLAAGTTSACSAAVADLDHFERTRYGPLLEQHASGQPTLRVKVDKARNRLWALALQHVDIVDIKTGKRIKRVALPPLSVAGIQCPPDLILDRAGSALISSNAEPRLWKIDARDFGVQEHVIRLRGKEDWDGGFGALAFTADGSLYALSSFAGALWRIELATSSANEIKLSQRITNACVMQAPRQTIDRAQPQGVTLCADTGKGARRIKVSADFTRARVASEQCNE